MSLPWREHHEPLPRNHEPSLKRLYGLQRRIKQDPEVLLEYDAILCDQLMKGVVNPSNWRWSITCRIMQSFVKTRTPQKCEWCTMLLLGVVK